MKTCINVLKMSCLIGMLYTHTQAQYALRNGAFNNGGALNGDGSYILNSVIGEGLSGTSANASNSVNSGFIPAAWISIVYDDPLPIELVSFTATTPGDTIILIQFSTASEVNVAGFNILRSEEEYGQYHIIANYINNEALLSFGNSSVGRDYSWQDKSAKAGTDYWYKLQNIDIDGSSETFGPVHARLKELPQKFRLAQNYPNPFNPSTTINYELPSEGRVKIEVFNVLGQRVISLLNKTMPAGYHSIDFQANNLPSGLYFYALQAGPWSKVKKMMLVK